MINKFKINDAIWAAELAAIAYLSQEKCLTALELRGYDAEYFDTNGVQAFVAWNDTELVYCFAGTNEPADWLRNLNFKKRTIVDNVKSHAGFRDGASQVSLEMMHAIYRRTGKKRSIIGIGHSAGAAFCVLFSNVVNKILNQKVFLFGCPRVGNYAFVEKYGADFPMTTWRIVNNNDAVCRTPPAFLGYKHVGTEVYLTSTGERIIDPPFWRHVLGQFIGRAKVFFTRGSKADGIQDHLMDGPSGYIEALKKSKEAQ